MDASMRPQPSWSDDPKLAENMAVGALCDNMDVVGKLLARFDRIAKLANETYGASLLDDKRIEEIEQLCREVRGPT